MKRIKKNELNKYLDHTILRDIYYNGTILIHKGSKINNELIQTVNNIEKNYVLSIFVESEDSESLGMNDILKEEIMNKVNCQINFIMARYSYSKSNQNDIKLMNDLIVMIIQEIMNEPFFTNHLENLILLDWRMFCHVIRVTALSLVLSIKAKLPKNMIKDICIGGIVHDIGRIQLILNYPKITEYNNKFDLTAFSIIRTHPIIGYEQALNNKLIPLESKKIILFHHVWEDKKASYNAKKDVIMSYPEYYNKIKIRNDNKDIGVNIIQVANTYDNLIHNMPPNEIDEPMIIEFIKYNAGIMFSVDAANLLYEHISPFKVGCKVVLSDNTTATVLTQTADVFSPIIRTSNNEDINLTHRKDLSIIGMYNINNMYIKVGKDVKEFDKTIKDTYYL